MAESGSCDEFIDEETAKLWESEQKKLKEELIEHDTEEWQIGAPPFSGLHYIGGVDISFVKTSNNLACVSLIVCRFPELEVVYEDFQTIHLTQPYISGFLAFREVPFFMECLEKLRNSKSELIPQVIFVDGNGILHPRGFGTACHLGVQSGIPTIGIAKKLTQVDGIQKDDKHANKVSLLKGGETFDLIGESGKVWGKALRSCEKTINPIYVSVGHRISLETATALVKACCQYRIPEPVRQADIRSREYLRQTFPEHYPASSSSGKKMAQKKHSKERPAAMSDKARDEVKMKDVADEDNSAELRQLFSDGDFVKLCEEPAAAMSDKARDEVKIKDGDGEDNSAELRELFSDGELVELGEEHAAAMSGKARDEVKIKDDADEDNSAELRQLFSDGDFVKLDEDDEPPGWGCRCS